MDLERGFAEADEDVLKLDIPDDAVERAAGLGHESIATWAYCTVAWYNCGWPL